MSRHVLRAGVVCAVATLSLLVASPAFALTRDDGDEPGEPMSRMDALLIFVGIPFGSLVLIWVVCSAFKNPPWRPGYTVQGPPIWYGGPELGGHSADVARLAGHDSYGGHDNHGAHDNHGGGSNGGHGPAVSGGGAHAGGTSARY